MARLHRNLLTAGQSLHDEPGGREVGGGDGQQKSLGLGSQEHEPRPAEERVLTQIPDQVRANMASHVLEANFSHQKS